MNNELYHYGVLGMKWGIRRASSKGSRGRKSHRRSLSEDAVEVRQIRKKSVGQMSNAELRKVNERKRLEQEYSRLNPGTIKRGIAISAGIVGALGTIGALADKSGKLIELGKKFFLADPRV